MVAVGYGARSRIHEQINNLGTNMIVITPGASTSGGVSQGAQAFATLTLADADKIRNEAQTVVAVSPVIIGRSQVIAAGGNWRTAINGVDTDYPDDPRLADRRRRVLRAGRRSSRARRGRPRPHGRATDLRRHRPRGPGDPGCRTSLQGDGVLVPKGQTASGSDSDDVILIPYTTAATRLTGRPRIPRFSPAPPRKATLRPHRTRSGRCCASRITSAAMTRTISRSAIRRTSPPRPRAARA